MRKEAEEDVGSCLLSFDEVETGLLHATFGGTTYLVRGTYWDEDSGFDEYELVIGDNRPIAFATQEAAIFAAYRHAYRRLVDYARDTKVGSEHYAALLVESKDSLAEILLRMCRTINKLHTEAAVEKEQETKPFHDWRPYAPF